MSLSLKIYDKKNAGGTSYSGGLRVKTSHDNGETWIWHERDDAMSEDPNMFVVTPAISVPYPAVGTKGICSGQRSICGLENILVPDNSPVFEYDIGNDGFTYVTSLPNLKGQFQNDNMTSCGKTAFTARIPALKYSRQK